MDDVKTQTKAVYEAHAAAWDRERSRVLFEKPWLDRLLAFGVAGDCVLDVGCGAGEPVAGYLVARGRRVYGVDFSAPMIGMARARFPGERWMLGDMRALDLGETFAGVVAWDSFFHLTAEEQRATLPRLCAHVAPGGALLATVGPAEGEAIGAVDGAAVYHASLSIAEYERLLNAAGMRLVAFTPDDPDCAGHSVLLAAR
ncbi:trans-aconitate 2-methyltransferase [Parvibaculum sp.]|uniref:class I SAM-dependent methyltransferase n=1 Tax=Parvibaculum sp. TaxID=2024848 RepID=UPI002730C351|nr:class I SAM-dependent methyltransferase [Parvibaculum sp.]MDP1627781.1 class I SAM-dependent methyltransferase [Parvibaculum sp.]MDP2150779.1 class I SAM-dependent methyltransferase [Parvibaculum sp.]MDP3327676.1 class I SAM-dependent methyltransferase [Parvibaculum sp.]